MSFETNDIVHAMKFAKHVTLVHLFEKYSKSHPDIFEHAEIDVRPATRQDYYIPPGLENEAVVVTRLEFTETGCLKVGCFPYKENLEPCDSQDPVRWIRIGKGFSLACQPICNYYEHNFDTRFENGRCYLANIYKKLFALLPENVFGIQSKHNWHKGLDVKNGHLSLNDVYCRSYGLDFKNGDCTSSVGQNIGEVLLGSSIFRSSFTAKQVSDADLDPFPPLPDLIPAKKRRNQRSVNNNDDDENSDNATNVAQELSDLATDLGFDISVTTMAHILKKRVPKMLAKPLTVPVKSAMMQAVIKSHLSTAANISKMAGNALSKLNVILFAFTAASLVLDVVDVFDYNKVLSKQQIDRIDLNFDVKFYGSEFNFKIPITPDYVWEQLEDQTENYLFYAVKVQEYLNLIHPKETPPIQNIKKSLFDYDYEKDNNSVWWNHLPFMAHILLVILILIIFLLISGYVEYFVVIIFFLFALVDYKKILF